MIKKIFNTYWESTIINGKSFLLNDSDIKIKKATFCIHIFYFLVFYLSIKIFSPYGQFPKWDILVSSERLFTPVWSLFWVKFFDWEITIKVILFSFFFFAFLAMIFWRHSKVVRIMLFFSMFIYLSLIFSFANKESWMYLMNMSAFLLIFIPNTKNEQLGDIGLLYVFFGIQTFLLNTYFISGILKFHGIIRQEISGPISVLNKFGMGEHSAMNAYHHNTEYFFTSFVLNHPSYIFSSFLIFGFCLELFSIYIIYKPQYHRIWGFLLLLLHSFVLMFIGPDFSIQFLTIGIFVFFSPFTSTTNILEDLKNLFKSLGLFVNKPKSNNTIIVFYDGERISCNRFLNYISNSEIQKEVRVSSQNSNLYHSLTSTYQDLGLIDSIIVLEYNNSSPKESKILLKANAITWLLAKCNNKFKILRIFYQLVPFLGNLCYDLVSMYRTKSINKEC